MKRSWSLIYLLFLSLAACQETDSEANAPGAGQQAGIQPGESPAREFSYEVHNDDLPFEGRIGESAVSGELRIRNARFEGRLVYTAEQREHLLEGKIFQDGLMTGKISDAHGIFNGTALRGGFLNACFATGRVVSLFGESDFEFRVQACADSSGLTPGIWNRKVQCKSCDQQWSIQYPVYEGASGLNRTIWRKVSAFPVCHRLCADSLQGSMLTLRETHRDSGLLTLGFLPGGNPEPESFPEGIMTSYDWQDGTELELEEVLAIELGEVLEMAGEPSWDGRVTEILGWGILGQQLRIQLNVEGHSRELVVEHAMARQMLLPIRPLQAWLSDVGTKEEPLP